MNHGLTWITKHLGQLKQSKSAGSLANDKIDDQCPNHEVKTKNMNHPPILHLQT